MIEGEPEKSTRLQNTERWELMTWHGVVASYSIRLATNTRSETVTAVDTNAALFEGLPEESVADAGNTLNTGQTGPRGGPGGSPEIAIPVETPSRATSTASDIKQLTVSDALVERVRRAVAIHRPQFPIPAESANQAARPDVIRRQLQLSHIDAFRKSGVKDARWNDKAEAFLTRFADVSAQDRVNAQYQLISQAQNLVALDCADPLVLSACAAVLGNTGMILRAIPIVTQAESTLGDCKYEARWQLAIRLRTLILLQHVIRSGHGTHLQPQLNQHQVTTVPLIVRAIAETDQPDAVNQRNFETIRTIIKDHLPIQHLRELLKKLQQQTTGDAWLRSMVRAEAFRALGWMARGTGMANSVSQEGWNGFRTNLKSAQALALQAWFTRPDLSEAATAMMDLAATNGAVAGYDLGFWVEQAVRADYTNPAPYRHMQWYGRPRWGGSHEQMLQFARQCLDGGRFDTNVPWEFHVTVQAIASEFRNRGEVYRRFELYDDYVKLLTGYARAEGPARVAYRESQLACVAFLAGRESEARSLLEKLGDSASATAFAALGANLTTVRDSLVPQSASSGETQPFGNHQGHINGLVVTNDGKLLISVASDPYARVWDLSTEKYLGGIEGHDASLTAIQKSHKSGMVATGDQSGAIVVWDPRLRKELVTLRIVAPVRSMEFSADDRFLIYSGGDGHIRMWDLEDDRLAATFDATGASVGCLSLSPDGGQLMSVPRPRLPEKKEGEPADRFQWLGNSSVTVWDMNAQSADTPLDTSFQGGASIVRYAHQKKWVAVAGVDFQGTWGVQVLNLQRPDTPVCHYGNLRGRTLDVVFSPDDSQMFVACEDHSIHVADPLTGEALAKFVGHQQPVRSLAVLPDGSELISGDEEGVIRRWSLSAEALKQNPNESILNRRVEAMMPRGMVHGPGRLATHTMAGVTLWSETDGYTSSTVASEIEADRRRLNFALSRDASLVAVCIQSGTTAGEVIVWKADTGEVLHRLQASGSGEFTCIAFTSDNQRVASGTSTGNVVTWNLTDGDSKPVSFSTGENQTYSLAFSPDRDQLATGGLSGVRVWDLAVKESNGRPKIIRHFTLNAGQQGDIITQLAWIPGSQRVIAASQISVDIWDLEKPKPLLAFPGATFSISPDRGFLATATCGATPTDAFVWNLSSGEFISRMMSGHSNAVHASGWSNDSSRLITASTDGTIRCWRASNGLMLLRP
ncbi:MAG: hypothetical protein H8E37_05440 [Planctomycetes bacterium]|nr:hypothetical protein [Planctomycetota bacterium]